MTSNGTSTMRRTESVLGRLSIERRAAPLYRQPGRVRGLRYHSLLT